MLPLERSGRCRTLCAATLCLCLALLLGSAASAAVPVPAMQQAGPVMTAPAASRSLPGIAGDCQTCAVCVTAPAPSAHGFTGEGNVREQAPVAWPAHATSVLAPTWFFDTGGWRVRWPVRIAFCRWPD